MWSFKFNTSIYNSGENKKNPPSGGFFVDLLFFQSVAKVFLGLGTENPDGLTA